MRRHKDHGNSCEPGVTAQDCQQLFTGHLRHREIQKNQRGLRCSAGDQHVERLHAVYCFQRRVSRASQGVTQLVPASSVVFNDEHNSGCSAAADILSVHALIPPWSS